ncbi:OmpA family protein [Litoreibacter sp.]|nr:OmpA family protein [Litoreibacter sp.]
MTPKTIVAYILAALMSVGGAQLAVGWVENRSEELVSASLIDGGHDWANVNVDGLLVLLGGTAPDEATRFRVVSAVGRAVDPDRIVDDMGVRVSERAAPPRFTVEMLRNGDGISLIGLVPEEAGRDAFTSTIEALMDDNPNVTDMLDTAAFPTPRGWDAAIEFATQALNDLPRSKISVSADRIEVTAISESPEDKRRIEAELARAAPSSLKLVMNITAPRPVISPFTLRFELNDDKASFDACSADTRETRNAILIAAASVGTLPERPTCAIGLGVPSPNWAKAVDVAMKGLKALGGGSLTFSDADITLIALDTTPQGTFDRVIGDLDATLPDVFSLHAVLPEKILSDGTVPEFVATHSPEGSLQMRGRLPDDGVETIVRSYARAQFGSENVYLATRDDPDLPANWPVRVLAGLEALAMLENGVVTVQEDYLELRGVSGSKTASDDVSRLLAGKLNDTANFEISVRYDELLDRTLDLPTPQECVDRINGILAVGKIVFEPSSAEITQTAGNTIDAIAEIAKQCDRVQMEIGGHTDSQGREIMNEELSQQRADSVLLALQQQRVRTRNLSAKGYGEAIPIADNGSETGREANRRIEFKLLTDARAAATDEAGVGEAAIPATGTQVQDEEAEATSEQN